MGDFATLRFGPKNASRRVVFGHGVGGLDFSANTFIKGAVEHWSTDPRLRQKDPYVPLAEIEKDKAFLADRSACDVQVRTFNMGHESCEQELAVCANWLAKVLAIDGDDDVLGSAAGVNFIK